ncbi:MAG: hypothetical protein IJ946_04035 [Clostridia bacterium]|nr:hypothetical protein [Clostridia bacterium]
MKKIISFVLCIILLVGILPSFSVSAADYSGAETAFITAVLDGESSLNLKKYNITVSQLAEIEKNMYYRYPETHHYYYNCNYNYSGNYVTKISSFNYKNGHDKDSIYDSLVSLYTTAYTIIYSMPDGLSDLEKALYLHDWIATYYKYDMDYYKINGQPNYTVYELFTEGKGVCQAYSFAYHLLLRECGIESKWVRSNEEDNHSWNLVKIGGRWYHVDITHDDPIVSEDSNAAVDFLGQAMHRKFLLSDAQINDGLHDGWYDPLGSNITCSAYSGGSIWKEADSSMVYTGGYWYYLDYQKGGLVRTDRNFSTSQLLATLDKKWYYNGGADYYSGYYSGMAAYNGRIFYSDWKSLYSYDIDTGKVDEIAHLTNTNNGVFFGFIMSGTAFNLLSTTNIYSKYTSSNSNVFYYELCLDTDTNEISHEDKFLAWKYYGEGQIYDCDLCGTILDFSEELYGDANGDTIINTTDLATLKLYLAGISNSYIFADIDRNGELDTSDLASLKLKLAGIY